MRKSRKNYTSVEKVAILRRHLIDRASISDLCDEYQLSPTLFYAWQKLFFDRESMTEAEVETIIQRARERFPGVRPRIISDNGPQFIAKDFKEFIRICGMTHVRTSPYYPQSNGKMERWYKTLKGDCIRVKTPLSLEDARRIVAEFVAHYNEVRLHSAIGHVTPADKLAGRERTIFAERDRKLDAARERRRAAREASRTTTST